MNDIYTLFEVKAAFATAQTLASRPFVATSRSGSFSAFCVEKIPPSSLKVKTPFVGVNDGFLDWKYSMSCW